MVTSLACNVSIWYYIYVHSYVVFLRWHVCDTPSGHEMCGTDNDVVTSHFDLKISLFIYFIKLYFCMGQKTAFHLLSLCWHMRLYQGLYSLSGKTSYRKISWSLEAARFGFKFFQSLWNLAGTSAALLPGCLSNFRAIRPLQHPISRLRDFTRFGGKTSYRLMNRGPGSISCKRCWYNDITERKSWLELHCKCEELYWRLETCREL